MTEFPKRIASTADSIRSRTAPYAEKGTRIARRARDIAAARLAERRVHDQMRVQPTDAFVAGVHFAGDADSTYQLEQWLGPLEGLRDHLREALGVDEPVGILCRSADHAVTIAERTTIPVRFSRLSDGLSAFMLQASLRVVFYVNQSMMNFQALRFAGPAHIHLSHGESEKDSMISNQLKAYDWVFTAGPAARERIEDALIGMPQSRMMDVGRPQLDMPRPIPGKWSGSSAAQQSGRTVFVAPTWEGDSPAMAYGTIAVSGIDVLTSLFDAGFRVIFRPHPRTGVVSAAARKALEECSELVEHQQGGFLDTTSEIGWQLDVADAAVCEMSSVAFDWLSTGKPLIMIRPADTRAFVVEDGLLDRAAAVVPNGAGAVGQMALEALAASVDAEAAASALSEWYLGPVAPGQQQRRFVEATVRAIRQREDEIKR